MVANNANDPISQARLDAANLVSLAAKNMTGILGNLPFMNANGSRLGGNWRNRWAQYWSILKPHASHIRAFYPFDEPQASVISNRAFGTICKALKSASPTTPILTVLDPASVEGIEFGTFPELPPEVDWIGFDNYGCWNDTWWVDADGFGHGCWQNRTMEHNLGVLDKLVESRGGRLVVVPDGMAERKCSNAKCTSVPTPPTADQQHGWVTRDQQFFTYCASNPRCVAMLVFVYNSVSSPAPQGGEEMIVGVNQMTEVLLPALKKMGTAIKMGGVAKLLLETQQEATTIKTDDTVSLLPQIKAATLTDTTTSLKNGGLKTDDRGVAAQMAAQTLTGNWTQNVTQAKGSISHIEIWQTGTELYLRTTAWGASPSTGSVDSVAMTATVQMVGGSAEVAKIENNYSWLAFTGCPGNCWCKFPHCPMLPPARWPPFPPAAGTGWLAVPAYPPLAPPFPQTWQLNRSTIIHTSNLSGWTDATSAAKYGIVSFDCE